MHDFNFGYRHVKVSRTSLFSVSSLGLASIIHESVLADRRHNCT